LVDDFRPTPFFSFHHVIRWFDLEVNKWTIIDPARLLARTCLKRSSWGMFNIRSLSVNLLAWWSFVHKANIFAGWKQSDSASWSKTWCLIHCDAWIKDVEFQLLFRLPHYPERNLAGSEYEKLSIFDGWDSQLLKFRGAK
jgi:hypothetical protein